MENAVAYFMDVLAEIEKRDPLHIKTLMNQMPEGREFRTIRKVVYGYFHKMNISAEKVACDYLQMVQDMRKEGIYFAKHGEYSCKSEADAYDQVYSKPEIMTYYMNALMASQVLWRHHFEMIQVFKTITSQYGEFGGGEIVLDVGAGHGLFSLAVMETMPKYNRIDVLDVSEASLDMAHAVLGNDRVEYIRQDIKTYRPFYLYDIIIMGEILEHMDDPVAVLKQAVTLLATDGVIWLTVPTNAPAIDHIYLFRGEDDVKAMISDAGLQPIYACTINVDSNTDLIGAFCVRK